MRIVREGRTLDRMTRARWIGVGATLLIGIVTGIVFGYLAGIAVVLGVLTLFGLGFGWRAGFDSDMNMGRSWGEKQFGSDASKRPER